MGKKNKKNSPKEEKIEPKTGPKQFDAAKNSTLADILASQSIEDLNIMAQNIKKAMLGTTRLTQIQEDNKKPESEKMPNMDPLGLAPYNAEVMTKIISNPENLAKSMQDLWMGYGEIWLKAMQSEQSADGNAQKPTDKRFSAPEWRENIMFDVMSQTYLHTSNWINKLVSDVDGVDDLTKRKTQFFTSQLANAFSPANFLLTNPVALKEMVATKGESLVHGIKNLADDFERGKGRISVAQTDYTAFAVGSNIAVTPGKVVYRGELFELIQYTPTTKTVHQVPILFFPPWINKYYILDMRQNNSMVKWLTDQGHSVFVVSWVNPTKEQKDLGFEDYMEKGIFEALDAVCQTDIIDKVNCVGYCIGGTLLASTMAHMSKIGDERINSATFFASQQDFTEAGDLKIFTDDASYQFIADEIEAAGGVLESGIMADTFNYLRSNDLVWSFVVNNYLLGKAPKPFDLLFWNSDQTRMPKNLHLFYLDNFYRKNKLSRGKMKIKGEIISLGDVKTPIYMQSSKEDHIAPYRSIYKGAKLFGGDVRMILAGSGHIAGVINHPDANKYNHYLPIDNAPLPETVDEWQATLTEHKGSWWNDWNNWLKARSGPQVPARKPGSGDLPIICDAPGTYVLVK